MDASGVDDDGTNREKKFFGNGTLRIVCGEQYVIMN